MHILNQNKVLLQYLALIYRHSTAAYLAANGKWGMEESVRGNSSD